MADAMEMLSVALAAYGYAVPADVLRAACQRAYNGSTRNCKGG